MTKYLKYLAGMMMLAAMAALLACGQEETPAPAAPATGDAQPTAAAMQATEAPPTAMAEAAAATNSPEAVPMIKPASGVCCQRSRLKTMAS